MFLFCGLPLLGLHGLPVADLPPLPRADEPKTVRDAFGEFPNLLETENFAIKWGSRTSLSDIEADALGATFEAAWAAEVVEFGYPAPVGSDRYKFNVYLADSGDGAPPSFGAAYYSRDEEGLPFIAVSPGSEEGDGLAAVAAHELFHAVQDAAGSYSYDGKEAWFWEATAMWIEGEIYPDRPDWYGFLFGFSLMPHLPVTYFSYPDSGSLDEYHQYGAAVWPRFLTEHVTDREIIHSAWVDAPARTPQGSIAELLAQRGLDVGEVFTSFAAHNALWDYGDGPGMAASVDTMAGYYPDWDDRVVEAIVVSSGDEAEPEWIDLPEETLPGAFGTNQVEWLPLPGVWRVSVEGDRVGSDGALATWGVTVALVQGGEPVYLEVPLVHGEEGSAGEIEITLEGRPAGAWIVASVLPDGVDEFEDDENWAWRVAIGPVVPEIEEPDPELPGDDEEIRRACACSSGPQGAPFVGLLGLAALVHRRRVRS